MLSVARPDASARGHIFAARSRTLTMHSTFYTFANGQVAPFVYCGSKVAGWLFFGSRPAHPFFRSHADLISPLHESDSRR